MMSSTLSSRLAVVILGLTMTYSGAHSAFAQPEVPPADTLLTRSLAHHDPDGIFESKVHTLTLREIRPGSPDRETTIRFDGAGTRLEMTQTRDGHVIEATVNPEGCQAKVDGESEIPDALVERYRLTCDGLRWIRDYYAFLFSLPMKLTAPGTKVAPEAKRETFEGAPVDVLTVRFDEAVGTDTWQVYLDPETHAMVGYGFYHDAPGDGEYVVLDGEATASGIRLPRERRWYETATGELLGTDVIESYAVEGK